MDETRPLTMSKLELPEQTLEQWQQLVELMAELLNVPSAIITRAEPPLIEVVRASTNDDNPYQSGQCVKMNGHYCQEVIRSKRRLQVTDARTDPAWRDAPEIEYGIVSYLGLPVSWPDGEIFGTICVLDEEGNEFGPLYERLLEQFCRLVESQLALICRNRQLEQSLKEIRTLRGILPICVGCKKIRDDQGLWQQLEQYVSEHSEAMFSHGLCPTCQTQMYG
jgi:GAF domain-containing protein